MKYSNDIIYNYFVIIFNKSIILFIINLINIRYISMIFIKLNYIILLNILITLFIFNFIAI